MSAFPCSTRFTAACLLINTIPSTILPKVLKRILTKITIRDAVPYTDDELSQLSGAFKLTIPEVNDCLNALQYCFSQAAYSTIKPAALSKTLEGAQMATEHVAVVVAVWEKEAGSLVQRLRESSVMGAPKVAVSNDWNLSINMSSSGLGKTKSASARFEVDLATPKGGEEETVAMEFNHSELYEFFKKLEQVQVQLDELS